MSRARTVIEAMRMARNNDNVKSVCVGNTDNGFIHWTAGDDGIMVDGGSLFVNCDDVAFDENTPNTVWLYFGGVLMGSLHFSDIPTTIYTEYYDGTPSLDALW